MKTLHASGHWKTSNADVRAQVAEWITAYAPRYLTHTEAARHRAALTLHDGYGVIHPRGDEGQAECAIQYRLDGPPLLDSDSIRLSSKPIPRRNGDLCYATWGEFADHHLIAVHMPSGAEGPGGLLDNAQSRVYRDAIGGLRRLVAGLDGPVVITGDWNLDLREEWVRAYLHTHFPDFTPTTIPVAGGTHSGRFIDFSLVRGYTARTEHVMKTDTSDHHALLERIAIKEPAVTKGIYPAAKQLPIAPGSNDPAIVPRIAILHVDAGDAASLRDFFATRSGGIESHFHVRRDGVVEQYRNIFRQADANLRANDFAVSIETQGFGEGEWTPAQLDAIKALLLWLNREAGIPLVRVPRWDGAGVGYHVMFGAPGPWTPVAKSCPGPDRIKQFDRVLTPWMKTALTPPPPPPPAPKPAPATPSRVQRARILLERALKILATPDKKR